VLKAAVPKVELLQVVNARATKKAAELRAVE
jgi:hypothetical protein